MGDVDGIVRVYVRESTREDVQVRRCAGVSQAQRRQDPTPLCTMSPFPVDFRLKFHTEQSTCSEEGEKKAMLLPPRFNDHLSKANCWEEMFVMKNELSANSMMLLGFLVIQSLISSRSLSSMSWWLRVIRSFAETHFHERSAITPLFFPLVIFQAASHFVVSTLYSFPYSVPIIVFCPE